MSYGPAPESADIANKWLAKHNRNFGHFVNGEWYHPSGERKTYTSKCPADGKILTDTVQGTQEDVDYAVDCANTAQEKWRNLAPHVRAKHLYAIARTVQKHHRLIAVIESLDNGKSIRETRDIDVPLVARHFYHHAGWAQLMPQEMANWKPVGVVGAIVPWNFPLMLLTWKVAPALAMGNTIVLKPATYTRLSALLLAEICHEAGLPKGVFNVITGPGRFGSMLASHPKIDKVAFTGSTGVGQILRKSTAGTGKKLSLELGGKSPVVVFANADLDSAVEGIVDAVWFNQGQVCSAGSRLLVQQEIYPELIRRLKERLVHYRCGHSLDKCVDSGALVDKSQLDTINEYVQSALDEGADVYYAPEAKAYCDEQNKKDGVYYWPPTLVTNVSTVSRVVREEIFGPVLACMQFRTAKEAVDLANNTVYGLGASVWTESLPVSLEVALSIKAGGVWVNCHNMFDAAAGFGGYRESGYGRDGGKEGLFEYVKPKWQPSLRLPAMSDVDMKKFGSKFGEGSIPCPDQESNKLILSSEIPRVDRTYKVYYGGAQKRPDGCYSRPVQDIKNNSVLAYVADSNRKDVRNAVECAHKAQPGWGKRAAHNRAQIVYYMAENLDQRRQEVAENLSKVSGDSIEISLKEVDDSIERLFYWAAYSDKYGGTVQETTLYGATVCVREPVGVIGIMCPDDKPLLNFVSLFAPAIVRANSVIMVPSEKNPLPALDLLQVFETSDLPGGVVNILTGSRDHMAKYLTEHQNIEAIWYFGSREGSAFVEHESHYNLKRTWVDYGISRDWSSNECSTGEEFLYHSTQCKNIWMPMGTTFAK